jgi:O-antigen/teichoic acid export membrane protein
VAFLSLNMKNSIYSVLDTVFLPLLMLVATPIFVSSLGIEQYGIWMLINSLVVAMSVLNIGGVDTVIRYISKYRSSNDLKSIREIFSTVFVTQLVFALIVLLFALFLISFLQPGENFNIGIEDNALFETALQFGVLVFVVKLIEQVVYGYYKGYERFDITSRFSMISKLLLISAQVLTVINGYGLDFVFQNGFYVSLIFLIYQIAHIKIIDSNIVFLSGFKVSRIVEIFNFTKWTWVISAIATASSQLDRWLLASLANMQVLGYYSISLLIFNNLHSIMASAMGWVFPKVATINSNKEINQLYHRLQGLLLLASPIICFILINSDFIFELWLGQDTYSESSEYVHFLLSILPIYSLGIIPFYLVKGTGHIKYNFITDVGTFLIRFVLMYVLYDYMGIKGIIIALAVSGLFLSLYLIYILKIKVLHSYDMKIINMSMIPILFLLGNICPVLSVKVTIFFVMIGFYCLVFYETLYKQIIRKTI